MAGGSFAKNLAAGLAGHTNSIRRGYLTSFAAWLNSGGRNGQGQEPQGRDGPRLAAVARPHLRPVGGIEPGRRDGPVELCRSEGMEVFTPLRRLF